MAGGPNTFGLPRIAYPVTTGSISFTASPRLLGRYSAGPGAGQEIGLGVFDISSGSLAVPAASQFQLLGRKTAGAGDMEISTRSEMNIPSLEAANTFTAINTFQANVNITGNVQINQNALAFANPGVALLYLVNADGSSRSAIFQDAFGTNPGNYYRRANGTGAAPTAVTTNNALMNLLVAGYGATGYGTNKIAVSVAAAEPWTDAAQGTFLSFNLTTPTTTTLFNGVLRVDVDRGLQLMGGGVANVVVDTNRGLRRRALTFATLPAAATSQDVEFVITDGAAAPVWLAAAAGGGATRTPVISNGAIWQNG